MLIGKNVPASLWGEAVVTFVYLSNRSVNKNTADETPYELYFKREPNVSHLRVFGCMCMLKIQTKKRSGYQPKIEEKASQCIFVGYEQEYTYRVFDPTYNKIIKSRDVRFDETKRGSITINELDSPETEDDDEEVESEMPSQNEASLAEPQTYKEAMEAQDREHWQAAIKEEYDSLVEN